jgi:Tfp pilus assembly protein PilE
MLKDLCRAGKTRRAQSAGDTIVEVLIAIAVAAFAIGTAYAIANRSLQQAITARERNEATNLIQSQIAALKIRYIDNKEAFKGTNTVYDDLTKGFAVRTTASVSPLPATDFHFCLDEQSASPKDTTHQWAVIQNPFTSDSDADNINKSSPGFKYNPGNGGSNPGCVRNLGSTDYFVDISAQITKGSVNATNRTVYKASVRWAQVGNTVNGESTVYYRF